MNNNNVLNSTPYLRTSREFPYDDPQELSVEISKTYVDIANAMNNRTIGLFPTVKPAVTGNTFFISAQRQNRTLRQVYTFTSAGSLPHGINISDIGGFVSITGTFTDGSVWYPLPYVSEIAANNQVSIKVTSSNIVITSGGGTPPSITKGFVILEWLSSP